MTVFAAPAAPGMRRPSLRLIVLLGAGALVAGLAAGQFVVGGRAVLVLSFALLLLPVAVWKRPSIGPVLLVGSALLIDQFPNIAGSRTIGLTARVPLFHGLGGYRPSDLLLVLMIVVYLKKRGTAAVARASRTPLARAVNWFIAAVVFAILLGVGTGGIARVALTEARPFLYLGAAFLVASTFVTTRRAVEAVLWAFVVGTGLKGIQGLLLFLSVRHVFPRPEAILGHEESLFFGLFLLLTLALWLYDVRGRLRTTATWLVPLVVAADLTNGRRTAWLILPAGLIIAVAVGFACLPARRRFLGRLAIGLAIVSALYFPAYWNKTGGFAQPARAFHSAISPDPRDASSNLYRVQEDANLKYNIALAGPLGKGFGHPIDYALPIVDISDIDPYIAYIPHNGVWWVFLRLGVAGAIAFWSLLALGIMAACRLARSPDKLLGVVGMLVACAIPAYALLGYNDQGFFYYRVGFIMGSLLGLAEAARRLSAAGAARARPQIAPAIAVVPVPRARPRPVPVPVAAAVAVQRVVAVPPLPALPRRTLPSLATRRARLSARLERYARVAALIALPVAIGLFLWLAYSGPRSHPAAPPLAPAAHAATQPAVTQRAVATPAATKPARTPVAARPKAVPAHVVIAASAGSRGSWVQVRRGSATGKVLYEGVVAGGHALHFTSGRLWVRFGAAANVTVAVNGRPVRLFGTLETTLTAKGAV